MRGGHHEPEAGADIGVVKEGNTGPSMEGEQLQAMQPPYFTRIPLFRDAELVSGGAGRRKMVAVAEESPGPSMRGPMPSGVVGTSSI